MEPNDKPDPDSLAYWQTKLTEAWNKPDFVMDDTRYVLVELYQCYKDKADSCKSWRADFMDVCDKLSDARKTIKELKAQNEKLEAQLGEVCDMLDDMPCDFYDLFPDWKEKYGERA